jgi:hypothetical protein
MYKRRTYVLVVVEQKVSQSNVFTGIHRDEKQVERLTTNKLWQQASAEGMENVRGWG